MSSNFSDRFFLVRSVVDYVFLVYCVKEKHSYSSSARLQPGVVQEIKVLRLCSSNYNFSRAHGYTLHLFDHAQQKSFPARRGAFFFLLYGRNMGYNEF